MTLDFNGGKFKIMQIADVQEGAKVSPDTIRLLNAALDREQPDLVVFSGDQIWKYTSFKGNAAKVEEVLRKITDPVTSRKIPFAVCFGNHDRQVGLTNAEQFEIYKKFSGFIGDNSADTDGCGDQVIELAQDGRVSYLLYLLDSHSGLKSGGYDCVHKNQIDWYKKTRDKYEREYGSVLPSVVIQHIPVQEITELLTEVKKGTKDAVQGFRRHAGKWFVLNKSRVNENGFMRESPADPEENSGEFDAMAEKGDVKGIYFGHDHNNSFHGKVRGIDLCYTQGAGFHVYGPGLDRGVRVITLTPDGKADTYDLRYRDLLGRRIDEKLRYAVISRMPTNVHDAIQRAVKAAASRNHSGNNRRYRTAYIKDLRIT